MKKPRARKAAPPAPEAAAAPPAGEGKRWRGIALALGALAVVFEAYSGALHGPLLLDDLSLPYGLPDAESLVFRIWLGLRPLLMTTFYLNYQLSGAETFSYHVINVLLHWISACFVFLLLRRLLEMAGEPGSRSRILAVFGAAVFLLHPIQTESVAYIASRSDVLSSLFAFASLSAFLRWRGGGIRAAPAALVILLAACAVLSKEQAAVLPGLFLLVDLTWSSGSAWKAIRANARLYLPLAGGAILGTLIILRTLRFADTAGFGLEGLGWSEYFLTQCRVLWLYARLFVLPFGLNVDHDIPVSRGLTDHGAMFGMLALVGAVGLAWRRRGSYPLAWFGLVAALLLLAPTSSFLPIRDVAAERRVYAPMLGLLAITLDFLRKLPHGKPLLAAMTAAAAGLGMLTFQRAALYGSDIALWSDTVSKSPQKVRPRFQLAYALYHAGRCPESASVYAEAARLVEPDERLLIDWALALDCAGRPGEAVEKLRRAAALEQTAHVYATIGMVYGKQGKAEQALAALAQAEKLDNRFLMTYVYRGNVKASQGDWSGAAEQYRRALEIDPASDAAREALARARQALGAAR